MPLKISLQTLFPKAKTSQISTETVCKYFPSTFAGQVAYYAWDCLKAGSFGLRASSNCDATLGAGFRRVLTIWRSFQPKKRRKLGVRANSMKLLRFASVKNVYFMIRFTNFASSFRLHEGRSNNLYDSIACQKHLEKYALTGIKCVFCLFV